MLTREIIESGAWSEAFRRDSGDVLWTSTQIEDSLSATLAQRLDGEPVWLFAYGSLMWNPLIDFAERVPVTLDGWRRRFCIHLMGGRASATEPGRMLSLEAGGVTHGLGFRIADDRVWQALRTVWAREMIAGVYRPIWTEIRSTEGRRLRAIAFVAQSVHPWHETDSSVETVAPLIARAVGPLGTNAEYVMLLRDALRDWKTSDEYVTQLAEAIERL